MFVLFKLSSDLPFNCSKMFGPIFIHSLLKLLSNCLKFLSSLLFLIFKILSVFEKFFSVFKKVSSNEFSLLSYIPPLVIKLFLLQVVLISNCLLLEKELNKI